MYVAFRAERSSDLACSHMTAPLVFVLSPRETWSGNPLSVDVIGHTMARLVNWSADCLYGDEYRAVFAALGDLELAALGAAAFSRLAHFGGLRLVPDELKQLRRITGDEWRQRLVDYLLRPDEPRRCRLEGLIGRVRIADEQQSN